MRSVLIFFIVCLCFYACLSEPSSAFDYTNLLTAQQAIEKCMKPSSRPGYYECSKFDSDKFTPAKQGFGYCTIIRIHLINGGLHECQTTSDIEIIGYDK